MIYVKSILVGIAALMVSSILFVIVLAVILFAPWRRPESGGIGAVSIGIGPVSWIALWIVAVLIFAAGFWWEFRRASN